MAEIRIVGLGDTLKAMKVYSPNALKIYQKEIRGTANIIVRQARNYIPETPPMSGWRTRPPMRPRATPRPHPNPRTAIQGGGFRGWPEYNASVMRKGIVLSLAKSRERGESWASLLRVLNKSASGAIFEVAGRRSKGANAQGRQFITNLNSHYRPSRALWRAYDEKRDEVLDAVAQSIAKATKQFEQDTRNLRSS